MSNLVFDINGDLEYILFGEGRILHNNGSFTFEYHLKDHLGSPRVVFEPSGTTTKVTQINAYYPFGAPIAALSWVGTSDNRYKHTGMETIEDFTLGYVDNGARWRLSPYAPGFSGLDILAEKYPWLSPYAYCNLNPIRNIDPTGCDWYSYQEKYKDKNGEEQTRTRYKYTTEYRSQKDLDKAGIDGKYLGITHKTNDTYYSLLGNTFDLKNEDGSLSVSAQVAEKLDNAIINHYKGPKKNNDAYPSAGSGTRLTDMTVTGLRPGEWIDITYGAGSVTFFATGDNRNGYFQVGDGELMPIKGRGFFRGDKTPTVNSFVRKWGQSWDILYWRFKDKDTYKSVHSKLDKLLLNRF